MHRIKKHGDEINHNIDQNPCAPDVHTWRASYVTDRYISHNTNPRQNPMKLQRYITKSCAIEEESCTKLVDAVIDYLLAQNPPRNCLTSPLAASHPTLYSPQSNAASSLLTAEQRHRLDLRRRSRIARPSPANRRTTAPETEEREHERPPVE
jgi:hypothetical protein